MSRDGQPARQILQIVMFFGVALVVVATLAVLLYLLALGW